MGVIASQSIKKSVIMLLGVLIATISTLFIYPLNLELYGELQFIIASAALLLPIATLGVHSLVVRFYPLFKDVGAKNHGYLGLLFLFVGVALVLFTIISFCMRDGLYQLVTLLGWSPTIFRSNLLPIYGLLICNAYFLLVQKYLTNYQRVVVPSLLNEFLIKLQVPAIVLLSVYTLIDEDRLKMLYVIVMFVALLILLIYIYKLGVLLLRVDWSFITKSRISQMSEYAMYGVLGTLSSVLAFRIDTIMVAGYTDFKTTGIYVIALFIANILIIPSRSVLPLIGAEIADLHNASNIEAIERLYKKSSTVLMITGIGIFLLVWTNLESILSLTQRKDELMMGRTVVLYISIARIFDMMMGANGLIISYGKYYKWNFLFIIIMGVLTVTTNIYMIPKIGFVGAAIASLISLSLFNIIKFLFVYHKYRIQPFGLGTIWTILISLLCYGIVSLLPEFNIAIFDIIIRSVVILVVFGLLIYYFKISDDINQVVDKLVIRLKELT